MSFVPRLLCQRSANAAQLFMRNAPTSTKTAFRNFATSRLRQGGGGSQGGWTYRRHPEADHNIESGSGHFFMVLMYWWIFYGILTEPEHIVGYWYGREYPDVTKMTDEELGIPPIDE
eukprot:TRINITY_DN5196_c0_g1_i2.p1 TRINITY_DN5196_c0_g1~~TRINITY_DN5196_c0_g1_i2.p1  ORF type:complete len:117 (+),score=5.69 TRINITY_DN5196_c0_g1_i2:40-390(+)